MTDKKPSSRGVGAVALALALAAIAAHEGYVPRTYADPIGIPTSCYGHVGPENTPGRVFTHDECQRLLSLDARIAVAAVNRCIGVPMTDGQAAALVSFTYNVGGSAMCKSTLARLANAGRWGEACAQLERWVYAGGRKLPGLVKRRKEERRLCES